MIAETRLGALPTPSLAAVLDAIRSSVLRFVVVGRHEVCAVSLWVLHAHLIEAADVTPYLALTSAEKRCGKTRLLEVLERLVANPWRTAYTSTAALVRKVDGESPTLLLDESDVAFNGDKDYAQALRGVLNSGYERGGKHSVCVGQGANFKSHDFSTFCPKVIAGIGTLPDTVADRSIPIRLQRAAPGERPEPFRRRRNAPELDALREEIELVAYGLVARLQDAEPETPSGLSDRAADVWEPLLAIADAAGGIWPSIAREAAVALSAEREGHSDTNSTRLLAAIREAFRDDDRLSTAELIARLAEDESSPWAGWWDGQQKKPVGGVPRRLAETLTPFGVPRPKTVVGTQRGYLREWFKDAWNRYLPAASVPSPRESANSADLAQPRGTHRPRNPPASEIGRGQVGAPTRLAYVNPADLADLADLAASQEPLGWCEDDPGDLGELLTRFVAPRSVPNAGCGYATHAGHGWRLAAPGAPWRCGICHAPAAGLEVVRECA